jgi:formylmethanofuran dehydrogenase subunit D
MLKIDVTLISGRTSGQGSGLEIGKISDDYFGNVALIEIGAEDAKSLGVEDGDPVEVATSHGSVVVQAHVGRGLDPGMAFFPYGPWANQVFGSETEGTGMPSYKGIEATIERADGKGILSLVELVEGFRGGG